MAEEHIGPRPAAWTKLFSGFRVALDIKKLLLAGAGVVVMWLGWWVLSAVAYGLASKPLDYERDLAAGAKPEEEQTAWTSFKAHRASWNLLHLLAGSEPLPVEPADVATTLEEYKALIDLYKKYLTYQDVKVVIATRDKGDVLKAGGKDYPIKIIEDPRGLLKESNKETAFFLRDLTRVAKGHLRLAQGPDIVTIEVLENADKLADFRKEAASLPELEEQIKNYDDTKKKRYEAALIVLETKLLPHTGTMLVPVKYGGRLRASPWTEYRGENPYLLVARSIKATTADQPAHDTAAPQTSLLAQILDMVPVLLEPLYKILAPIIYLFHRDADWYIKSYLILVLLWAIAVWAFFGGAITRLAAVQLARNEKLPWRETMLFTKDHFISFFAAPAFPLLLLAILIICLWIFGWVEWIPIFGDIFVAGIFWPIVLIVGLIMAVVLVGLIGWPLMNPTISVEGSDSFNALSRSYSYVYQAIWHYLWYAVVAIAYGMALVFFVGLMASLLVFLGKWSVGMTPGLARANAANDREPSYLFMYAPTSFGWRDLLVHNSRHVVPKQTLTPTGLPTVEYEFTKTYMDNMHWYNYLGAYMVAFWVGAFFLLVIGFGYSYFWTAATIIYFLMRRQVDDTDMDEVHLEEEEALDPFARPASPAAAAAPKSDKVSLSVVEPPLRTAISPGAPPPAPFAAPPPAAPPTAPMAPLASTPPPPEPPLATPPPPAIETPPDASSLPTASKEPTEPPPNP